LLSDERIDEHDGNIEIIEIIDNIESFENIENIPVVEVEYGFGITGGRVSTERPYGAGDVAALHANVQSRTGEKSGRAPGWHNSEHRA
jgi:hypothetical protein